MNKLILRLRYDVSVIFLLFGTLFYGVYADDYLGMPVLDIVNGYMVVDVRPVISTISYQNGSAEHAWKKVSENSTLVPMHYVEGYPRWEYHHGEYAFRWYPEQFPYEAIFTMGIYYQNGHWVATKTGATRHNDARIIDFGSTYGGGGSYPEIGWNQPWDQSLPTVSVCFPVEGTHISVGVVVNDQQSTPEPDPPDNTYQLIDATMTWHQAKQDAESRGGYLATVNSSAEWNNIINQIGSSLQHRDAWIGATDEGDEGRWRWVSGEEWTFARWGSGQPNNANDAQHYAHAVCTDPDSASWFWDDLSDVTRACYILETGVTPNPTPVPSPTPGPTPVPTPTPEPGDPDGDGLTDYEEGQQGTNPWLADTDGDGINDGEEVKVLGTSPLLQDTDNDGITDPAELARNVYILVNPAPMTWQQARADAESRGGHLVTINTHWEYQMVRDTLTALFNGVDACWIGCTDQETEGQWQWVTDEPWYYTHWHAGQPNNAGDQDYGCFTADATDPLTWDDNNGYAELSYYMLEQERNTSPTDPDTDNDGLQDGWEIGYGLDPLTDDAYLDPDGDGLTNLDEFGLATHPNVADSDGDGFTDAQEHNQGTDPNNAADHPPFATAAVGDYDGDGYSDAATFTAKSGQWAIRSGTCGTPEVREWGWSNTMAVPGDYDGDGKTDIAVYCPAQGDWYIQSSADSNSMIRNWGWQQALPVPADYDGDGITDIAVYNPANGTWYIQQSIDGNVLIQQWGWTETIPVPADYDGDDQDDFAVFYPETGLWFMLESGSARIRMEKWGWQETVPVPADYDGDAKADIAVFHQTAGNWYIQSSIDQATYFFNWGWAQTVAVPADYDGDDITEPAVFWSTQDNWYVMP
jgi:hypothetical protein